MLHQKAVPSATLGLLKNISSLPQLSSFALGGGTNLALRLGHRLSFDLDFFTNTAFETSDLFELITKKFSTAEILFERNQTIMFNIMILKLILSSILFPG
jgi:hypothetical protein